MNLNLRRPATRPKGPKTLAIAKVYTKDGQATRIPFRTPLRRDCRTCAAHPEQQFIRWFNRRSAAEPGFPVRVRSILFVVQDTACPNCRQTLNRFLDQYSLGNKLRLQTLGAKQGCGCGHTRSNKLTSEYDDPALPISNPDLNLAYDVDLDGKVVDSRIPDGMLGNRWYKTLREAREAALAVAKMLGPGYSIKEDTNPRVGTRHFHVTNPSGKQVSGHFFYGEKPRYIPPKKESIPSHRSGKTKDHRNKGKVYEMEMIAEINDSLQKMYTGNNSIANESILDQEITKAINAFPKNVPHKNKKERALTKKECYDLHQKSMDMPYPKDGSCYRDCLLHGVWPYNKCRL